MNILGANIDANKQGKRYIVNSGGTRSGKTFNILTLLINIALKHKTLISVVSETFPHLRKGAIRDFQLIMDNAGLWQPEKWNKTESTYTFGSGGQIEFFSCDSPGKVHGPARKHLFINEAQNINHAIFKQLAVRTTGTIFIDFNPTHEFYAHTELKQYDETAWIHSTYLDNPYLSKEQIKEIERGKINSNWWRVYGLGEIGQVEGLVFEHTINDFPTEPKDLISGLDFGFTNDPSSIIDVAFNEGQIWLKERLYRTHMTNSDIVNFIKSEHINNKIIADSAEPKSIEELHRAGVHVLPATKGKDSINQGISVMQSYKINIDSSSTNLIKEFNNYTWAKDKEDNYINKPIDFLNHGIDACRYAIMHKLNKPSFFVV